MSVQVRVISNRFPAIATRFPVVVDQITGKAAHDASAASVPLTPVDQGLLRTRRGVVPRGGGSWAVEWYMDYAPHQNFGTVRGVRAKRFAEGGAESVRGSWVAALSRLEGQL